MDKKEFCNYISNLVIKSMLYEVSTTPKPGLVDRDNPGAHKDMDFFTFINSSVVLYDYFFNCTKAGIEYSGRDFTLLLEDIRPLGIKAEQIMFQATDNINTHKGLVFSFGIIGAAVGSLYSEKKEIYFSPSDVSDRVKLISKGITEELIKPKDENNLTYGEKLYIKYNTSCIRGEVESGFETVINHSIEQLKSLIKEKNYHINDILVQILLKLIIYTVDCNILGRHNMEVLVYVQEYAKRILDSGGYLSQDGSMKLKAMDKDFIERNISPGGAADLLAITLMFYFLENGDKF